MIATENLQRHVAITIVVHVEEAPFLGAGHKVYTIVRKGGVVGMVIDNRVRSGIVVPFMGRPARSSSIPAFIALRTGAAAIPTFCFPEAGGRYRLVFSEPIVEEGSGDEAVAALTERYLECIATEIRRQPEFWLWMHDRWKMSLPVRSRSRSS